MAKEWQQYLAELISTFSLIFIGAGAVIANSVYGNVGLTGIAFAHGLVLMAMIYATGHISGAHVNPAVTFAMWITKRIKTVQAALYIISQLIGATIAGFLLALIFSNANAGNLGTTSIASGISLLNGIIIEAVLTFFLVFTIFGVAVDKRSSGHHAGLAIGLVLAFDILMGGNMTGAAMNPARAFGPALASGFWSNHLVYWIGPLLGASVAALIYQNLFLAKENKKKVK